ncbi:hypothetical protein [Nocardia yamanashiensis]|uniref:hypothetical protein n=1 Tax=Nocardia yamanashiensis TaxID=209247 RepID=UPI00082CBB14|nr:hypothetical protein [Nocardia yamanashiensis]
MKFKPAGRIGVGIAGLAVAAGAALVVGNSPDAAATVDAISISSNDLRVGQTYDLQATLSGASVGLLIYWADNGEALTDPAAQVPMPPGHSSASWTPKTAGQHVITATQGGNTKSLVVTVTDGSTTVPPTTTVPPSTTTAPPTTKPSSGSGGLGSGSGGSGSAGKILGGLLGSS